MLIYAQQQNQKILSGFNIQTGCLIQTKRQDQTSVNEKTRTFQLVHVVVPAENRVKGKEIEALNKYLYLAWELRKLENMKVAEITIVVAVTWSSMKTICLIFL